MLHTITLSTIVLMLITGLTVLALGDWRKLGLKFAAVSLSTAAAAWLCGMELLFGNIIGCPSRNSAMCLTFSVYQLARNVAFILFHIAVGRDAIHFKKGERRGTLCQKNSSKRSLP